MLESRIIAAQSDDNSIENTSFEGEILSDVDIAGVEFESVQFIQCQFSKCNFSKASFYSSVFDSCNYDCNFTEAFLSGIWLKKPTLKAVNFTGADFFKTLLKGIDLSDCIIEGITVSDTRDELRGAIVNVGQAVELAARILGIKIV